MVREPGVVLAVASDVAVAPAGDELRGRGYSLELPGAAYAQGELRRLLLGAGVALADLEERALQTGGALELARVYSWLRQLEELGWLAYRARVGGRISATLESLSAGFTPDFSLPAVPLRLSRFVVVQRVDDTLVMESVHENRRIVAHDPAILELAFGLPTTPGAACDPLLMKLLWAGGMLQRALETQERDATSTWQLHDLMFHRRTRLGTHIGGYGRTRDLTAPRRLRPTAPDAARLQLARPSPAQLARDDRPFTDVLEARRSCKRFGDEPMDIERLGHFLYRAAGQRSREAGRDGLEHAARPYPSGGGLYEIEPYLAIARCRGVDAGLYRYEAQAHCLVAVGKQGADVGGLLGTAAAMTGIEDRDSLQVLVLLVARFELMACRYESIAYSTILKNVGAILQTLYLVATAMELCCCAVGGGDSEAFARLTGTDPLLEGTVGELLLGSPAC